MRLPHLAALLPFAALLLAPSDGRAAGATFQSHLVYQISGPGGTKQVNSSIVQVDLRKQNGKWSLYMAAADYDGALVKVGGHISPTCQVTSTDREEIVTAYKLVVESVNKIGMEVICVGTVSGAGNNTVDLQQAGHYFTISTHA